MIFSFQWGHGMLFYFFLIGHTWGRSTMWKSVACVTGECGACGTYLKFGIDLLSLQYWLQGCHAMRDLSWRCSCLESVSTKAICERSHWKNTFHLLTPQCSARSMNLLPITPSPSLWGSVHLLCSLVAEVGTCPGDLQICIEPLGRAAVALPCLLLGCVGWT